jgi:hypothetical protein
MFACALEMVRQPRLLILHPIGSGVHGGRRNQTFVQLDGDGKMIKRTMIAALLGLAVTSHAVLAQDMRSPAHPDPNRVQQPVTDDQKQAEQKQVDKYWNDLSPNYHNDDSPNYPFAP